MENKHLARTAVLYLTNEIAKKDLRNLEKLKAGLGDRGDVHVLFDCMGKNSLGETIESDIHRFDFKTLGDTGIPVCGDALTNGNAIFLILIDFLQKHPDYDYFWLVENDVRFSGNWSSFFSIFDRYTSDYISTGIKFYNEDSVWCWWELSHPTKAIPLAERLKSLNCISRYSINCLRLIQREMSTGWAGHYEVLLPTLIHHQKELSMLDMGGNGVFTPKELKGLIYKTEYKTNLQSNGHASRASTFHHRPPLLRCGSKENFLYHPVKSPGYYFLYRLKYIKHFLFVTLVQRIKNCI